MSKAKYTNIFSHWNTMIEGLDTSARDFFDAVEVALAKKKIPDIRLSRVDWHEGGILSAKREYLRIQRKELAYDIGAAPFGNGFFVSSWLGEVPSKLLAFLLRVPIIGYIIAKKFKRATYYKIDTASMFQSLVHSAVTEVVDSLIAAKGLRALSELEKKPEMKSFFKK